MPTILVAAPRALPLSRSYIKLHTRISITDEDLLLDSFIRTAAADIEAATWRQLVTATFDYTLHGFPCSPRIRLPRAPMRKVESIRYLDDAGVQQTFDSSNYRAVAQGDDEPGYVELGYGKTWPTTYPVMNAVTVRFVGGYATPIGSVDVDANTISAVGHTYADGDVLQLSTLDGDLPSPLQPDRDYYARDVVAGISLELSETSGGSAIDLEDQGGGRNFLGVIPPPLLHAIALLVRHFDENREAVLIGTTAMSMPLAVAAMIAPYSLASRL